MARVIEFYVPRNFRRPSRSAAQPTGQVIEFCPPTNKSSEHSPFIIWKLGQSWQGMKSGI
jgi:hypothetical protein